MSTVQPSVLEQPPALRTSIATARTAGWCALAAAAAHAAAVPEHLAEWPAAGVLFVVLAAGQMVLAGVLHTGTLGARALAAAIGANVGVVVLYVISRTSGVPSAPAAHSHADGQAGAVADVFEALGGAGTVAVVAELALLALLIAMLPPRMSRHTSTLLMLAGVALWVSSAVGLLG